MSRREVGHRGHGTAATPQAPAWLVTALRPFFEWTAQASAHRCCGGIAIRLMGGAP